MSTAQHDVGAQDLLLSHLQPRDIAAMRCRGTCFIEMDSSTSVDVAVTAFHIIFLISHQGTRASRLAWSDVASMHLSTSPQGRHCAIMEFLVHERNSSAHKPAAPSSPKLTKVSQMIHADSTAKEADASSRALKQIFAHKSVKISDEALVAKPLIFYLEDTRADANDCSIVIASQRAFLYFVVQKQMQLSLSTKSLIHDDSELLNQYAVLENEVAAAASFKELLPLLEDLEDGARHHTIKFSFLHRPIILKRLTNELSSIRLRPMLPRTDGPALPLLLSNALNIRLASAAFRCISAIACDAYSFLNKKDTAATLAAEQCLLAAVAPITSEADLSDVRMRVAISELLQAQVEAMFNCMFIFFRTSSPAPLASFLHAHLTPEQVTGIVSSTVYVFTPPPFVSQYIWIL
jgi:hypothetical protein